MKSSSSAYILPSSGMTATDLKTGMLVTVSSNKLTGDRSLVGAIWEITGVNGGHVLLTRHLFGAQHDDADRVKLVPLHEHDFYAAEELAAAATGNVSGMNWRDS